jgi:hypothetical protein
VSIINIKDGLNKYLNWEVKIMLNVGVGDYVDNKKNGHAGKVIGYGHQILKGGYETTLKVLVAEPELLRREYLWKRTCIQHGFSGCEVNTSASFKLPKLRVIAH